MSRAAPTLHTLLTLLALAAPASAQTQSLGPHSHGAGTLDIAVQGNRLAMELRVPSADIVGFEYPPRSYDENVAVTRAKRTLIGPLRLFVLPPAGCLLANVDVEQEFQTEAGGAAHSEFHASYAFTCADPRAVTSIDFRFFQAFPATKIFKVRVIGERGQRSFKVERTRPELDLDGAI